MLAKHALDVVGPILLGVVAAIEQVPRSPVMDRFDAENRILRDISHNPHLREIIPSLTNGGLRIL